MRLLLPWSLQHVLTLSHRSCHWCHARSLGQHGRRRQAVHVREGAGEGGGRHHRRPADPRRRRPDVCHADSPRD